MQAWDTPEHYKELLKLIPYKRIGEPEEIGRAAVWLASDESDYVQGTTLFVDGGMTLYPGFETGGKHDYRDRLSPCDFVVPFRRRLTS